DPAASLFLQSMVFLVADWRQRWRFVIAPSLSRQWRAHLSKRTALSAKMYEPEAVEFALSWRRHRRRYNFLTTPHSALPTLPPASGRFSTDYRFCAPARD